MYSGNTAKGKARVTLYRYPEGVAGMNLPGPEQVFALPLKKAVANFGVRVVSRAAGSVVTPRVVRNGDENRLTGYAGLPGDLNPYREQLGESVADRGSDPAERRQVQHRVRLDEPASGGQVQVPPLDQRLHAARCEAAAATRRAS